eukprot:SAG22_NODE_188_length_15821_cov_38.313319_4_plen_144_part_00
MYFAAGVGVVQDEATSKQKYFLRHDDDIECLSMHADRDTVASGQFGVEPTVWCVWQQYFSPSCSSPPLPLRPSASARVCVCVCCLSLRSGPLRLLTAACPNRSIDPSNKIDRIQSNPQDLVRDHPQVPAAGPAPEPRVPAGAA